MTDLPLVPVPLTVHVIDRAPFVLGPGCVVVTGDSSAEISAGVLAAEVLGLVLQFPVALTTEDLRLRGTIALRLDADAGPPGAEPAERYTVVVRPDRVEVRAPRAAGLLRGIATLRQLAVPQEDGDVHLPSVEVHDAPRYPWRGLALDLGRHGLSVTDVCSVLGVMADLKLNVLRLEAADGRLRHVTLPSQAGSSPATDLGESCTAQDHAEVVAFAAARHITVVTGSDDAGVRIDAGGRVDVAGRPAGTPSLAAVGRGARVLLAPASRAHLDAQHAPVPRLSLDRAGHVELPDAYDWEPDDVVAGLPAGAVQGVEATVEPEAPATAEDLFAVLLPRLAAVAEVAWSAPRHRGWEGFRRRVAGLADGWDRDGHLWYPSPHVRW